MRIIPKETKVRIEFFKGVELLDVIVGAVGVSLAVSVFVSNLPYKAWLIMGILVVFSALIIPIDEDKGYMMLYNGVKHLARPRRLVRIADQAGAAAGSTRKKEKVKKERKPRTAPAPQPEDGGSLRSFTGQMNAQLDQMERETQADQTKKEKGKKKEKEKKPSAAPGRPMAVEDITPFTGVEDNFILYGGKYYGVAIEIPSIEFRFLSEYQQNRLIERNFASILRTISGDESGTLVKIDRPIIFDGFIDTEYGKLEDLKEAYINEIYTDEELTERASIVYDRIEKIRDLNENNRVYKSFFYLLFFDKDKNSLLEQAKSAVAQLQGDDIGAHVLGEKELVVFLKYNYSQVFDEREVNQLTREQYMDWILPHSIEFTARTVKYDDLITHTLKLTDYPTVVGNAWGYRLFNLIGTRVVMKFKPVEGFKAVRRIDRAMEELRGQGENTGRASRLMELSSHIETLSELLVLLQGDNETLFDTNTYVTIYDYEMSQRAMKPELPPPAISFKKRIRRILAEESFKTTDLFAQQFEAYSSSCISAYDAFASRSRGIHSSSVAAVFPFVYSHLEDEGGVNLGTSDNKPVFVNFFLRDRNRVNSNMVIIGKSGSGKSYATKTLLANLAAENSKIFVLDPENEYSTLARNLSGKLIDVGSATQGRLNPFQIITGLSDDEQDDEEAAHVSFNTHLQFLEEFFRQILPGIDNDALEYLNNLVVRMYEAKGIDGDTDLSRLTPEDYPIFDDLYDKILNDFQTTSGEYSKSNLRVLLNYISKFSTGGRNANLWNGASTISTNENFIVFNFQSLLANKNNTIANAQMLLVLKYLDNEIIKNRDYNLKYGADRKIIVVIDEAHVFIDEKYPIALDFMFQLAKRIRKYSGMQIIITQNVRDFVGTEEIARKSTAIINACQYSFIFPLSPNDMHDLCKLYEKAGSINETEQEQIVNNGRGRAFVVTSPASRTCIDIVASDEVRDMFTDR